MCIRDRYNDETKPEKISKNVPFFGTVQVTENHVVSLRCDRGSSYKAYMAVPVSYTHLDVYKRQEMLRWLLSNNKASEALRSGLTSRFWSI